MTTPESHDAAAAARERVADAVEGHADRYRPLGAYATLIGAFNVGMLAFLVAAERRERLPDRFPTRDLALLAVGSFKVSRLIAKDRVTSALRAPFTRYQDDIGHGEVAEAARGKGMQRAIGELLVCDYCLDQWTAAGYLGGYIAAPRVTRALAALFTVYAAADVLQLTYARLLEPGS